MQVDACNRLWVLDVGVNDISSTYNVLSAPALLIYDLPTNKLIKRYQLPAGTLKDLSFFVSVVCIKSDKLLIKPNFENFYCNP